MERKNLKNDRHVAREKLQSSDEDERKRKFDSRLRLGGFGRGSIFAGSTYGDIDPAKAGSAVRSQPCNNG